MTPEQVQQVRQAIENHRRLGQTRASRIRTALAHVRNSKIKTPAGRPGRDGIASTEQTISVGALADKEMMNHVSDADYNP